jgi:hypothetical protein
MGAHALEEKDRQRGVGQQHLFGNGREWVWIMLSVTLFDTGDRVMVDQEVIGNQLKTDRFPFQSEGDITLAVRNANYTLGPYQGRHCRQ